MGADQSTRIEEPINKALSSAVAGVYDVSGNNNSESIVITEVVEEFQSDGTEESDEEEEDEYFEERLHILQDARQLRQVAEFFLCPEKPVKVDPLTTSRCYFTRYSAPDQCSQDLSTERELILEDIEALKRLAISYFHPELSAVTTDPCACGRNYFTRPSAPIAEDAEEALERQQNLDDMNAMKKLAIDYLHPELPVVTTDPFACGRNSFTRPLAVQHEDSVSDNEEEEEKYSVLEELRWMRTLTNGYMHPELLIDYSGEFMDATKPAMSSSETDGHFDMDEDITVSYAIHSANSTEPAKAIDSAEVAPEGSLAFSPSCVMMMQ